MLAARRDAGRQRRGAPHADAAAGGAVDRRRARAGGGAGERPRRARRRSRVPAARAGRAPGGARAPRAAAGHRQGREPDPLAAGAGPSARGARARRAPRRGRRGGAVVGAGAASLGRARRGLRDAQRRRRSPATGTAATRCSSWRPICCRSPAMPASMAGTARRAASLEARTPADSPVGGRGAGDARVQRRRCSGARASTSTTRVAARARPTFSAAPASLTSPTARRRASRSSWSDELDRAERAVHASCSRARRGMGRMQIVRDLLRAARLDAAARVAPSPTRRPTSSRSSPPRPPAGDVGPSPSSGRADHAGAAAHRRMRSPTSPKRGRAPRAVPPGFERGFMPPCCAMPGRRPARAGQVRRGDGDADELGELCEATGLRSPAVVPWRSDLALALAGSDRHDEAVELARDRAAPGRAVRLDRARGHRAAGARAARGRRARPAASRGGGAGVRALAGAAGARLGEL